MPCHPIHLILCLFLLTACIVNVSFLSLLAFSINLCCHICLWFFTDNIILRTTTDFTIPSYFSHLMLREGNGKDYQELTKLVPWIESSVTTNPSRLSPWQEYHGPHSGSGKLCENWFQKKAATHSPSFLTLRKRSTATHRQRPLQISLPRRYESYPKMNPILPHRMNHPYKNCWPPIIIVAYHHRSAQGAVLSPLLLNVVMSDLHPPPTATYTL